ncbi:MAG: DNA repair protein RadC, partial [Candidatus Nanohaloarchaea archaeon]|nr:DNA repair protein RadC [Candidatus Nanohaloarchaea archaeon]
ISFPLPVPGMRYAIKELPENERPRERLEEKGVEALSDAELLALVIRAGTEERNAVELSRELLSELGLDRLESASANELVGVDGIGEVKAGQIVAAFELSRRFSRRSEEKEAVEGFEDAREHVEEMRRFEEENFGILCLDSGNRLLSRELSLFRGSVNEVEVQTRVIAKKALRENASAVVLAHNHPSGDPEPSQEDVEVTEEVRKALDLVDVDLLDHIVVGGDRCTSLRKEGYL